MTFELIQERTLYALLAYMCALILDLFLSISKKHVAVPAIHAVSASILAPFLDRLDKLKRSKGLLIARGMFVQIVITALFVFFAYGLHTYIGNFADIIFLAICISPLSASFLAIKVYRKKDVGQGELYALARSANVNLNATDLHGVSRESLNWIAYSFGKNLVAPIVLYVLFGSTIVAIYSSVALFVWLRGKYGNSKGFAKPSIYFLMLLSTIPEYLAAFITALAAYLTPKTRKTSSIKALFNNNLSVAEGGVVTYTYAHTLGATLAGAAQHIDGGAIHRPWAGDTDTSAKIDPQMAKKAVYLTVSANIIFVFALTVMLL